MKKEEVATSLRLDIQDAVLLDEVSNKYDIPKSRLMRKAIQTFLRNIDEQTIAHQLVC